MKRCLTIITICVFSLSLGGCALLPSALRGMEALAVVQALGADREGDGVRLSMVTAADSSRGEGPVRMSGSGATIAAAAEDAAAHAAEEKVFCAHTGYVLLGEESAREDVTALLRWVCRSREIRMDVPLLIVRGASAEKALLESGGERVGAAELLDALASSAPARLGGELPSVARIAGRLESGGCAFAAAVACTPSSELEDGERPLTLAPAGLAVLKEGKLAAFLDPDEAVGADLLLGARGEHSFVVTDHAGQRVTLQTAPGRTELRVIRGGDGSPEAIEATICLSAAVAELDGKGNLSDGDYADELAALLERELLRRAGAVLRLEHVLGADLLSLPSRAGLDRDAELPVRLSASVRVDHANDVRDG